MLTKETPLTLLLQPSPAFGGFLEYLIDEAGYRVLRFESLPEARAKFEEAQPDFVLICSSLVDEAKTVGLLDPSSTVVLVGPAGRYCPDFQCIPKLFAPSQLRRATHALEHDADTRH